MRCSFTILLILVSSLALAVPVTPDTETGIAAVELGAETFVLCVDGTVHRFASSNPSWVEYDIAPPPVALEEIADWSHEALVSTSGELWVFYSGEWHQVAWPCEGAVAAERKSLGGVKSVFRR